MIILGILLSIAAIGFFCWLLFTLAVFALPFFAGLTTGGWAYHTGAGWMGAILIGVVAIWPQINPRNDRIPLGFASVSKDEIDQLRMVRPRYTGIPTFFRRPYTEDLAAVDIGVIGVPFDGVVFLLPLFDRVARLARTRSREGAQGLKGGHARRRIRAAADGGAAR